MYHLYVYLVPVRYCEIYLYNIYVRVTDATFSLKKKQCSASEKRSRLKVTTLITYILYLDLTNILTVIELTVELVTPELNV